MKNNKYLLLALLCSGASALIYQVAWMRPIGFVYFSTVYLFAVITTAFMFGLGLGGYLVRVNGFIDKIKKPMLAYAVVEILIGAYCLFLIEIFSLLSLFNQKLLSIHNPFVYYLATLLSVVFILGIPTTLMGATFPIAVRAYRQNQAAKTVGAIYGVNNLGAIIGSLLAGFVLLPHLGVRNTIFVAAGLNLAAGFFVIFSEHGSKYYKPCAVALVLYIILGSTSQYSTEHLYRGGFYGLSTTDYLGDREYVFEAEGKLSTVAVLQQPGTNGPINRLLIDGEGSSSLRLSDVRVSMLLGYLPRILHPEAKTAAVIGFGVGGASRALANQIETTTIEIEPEVVNAAPFFEPINRGILTDPNHKIEYDDARNYLLRTDETFDIIVNHPLDPNRAFSSLLFTQEFFEVVKSALSPNGVYVQWIPLYAMSKRDFSDLYHTLNSVFPHQVGFTNTDSMMELIVICSNNPLKHDKATIRSAFSQFSVQDRLLLSNAQLDSPEIISDLLVFNGTQLGEYDEQGKALTDNSPRLEFSIALNTIRKDEAYGQNIRSEINRIRYRAQAEQR